MVMERSRGVGGMHVLAQTVGCFLLKQKPDNFVSLECY